MSDAGTGLDASNRVVASILGLTLVLAGGYGLVRGLGGMGADARLRPVLDQELRAGIAEYAGWVAGVATLVALVVAWLGWRWLRRQLVPSTPLRRIPVGDGQGGRTWIDTGALAEAVTRDLAASGHVAAGQVRVVGFHGAPGLALTAEVAPGGDTRAVREHVAGHVVPRARAVLGRDELGAHVHLRLADPGGRTVG